MKPLPARGKESCCLEKDPGLELVRRAIGEGVGSFLLMFAISDSCVLSDSHLLGLFVGAIGTAGVLAGLIIAFGPVSVVISILWSDEVVLLQWT
jgi:hypothetical protein